jgi:hypothetical protein
MEEGHRQRKRETGRHSSFETTLLKLSGQLGCLSGKPEHSPNMYRNPNKLTDPLTPLKNRHRNSQLCIGSLKRSINPYNATMSRGSWGLSGDRETGRGLVECEVRMVRQRVLGAHSSWNGFKSCKGL